MRFKAGVDTSDVSYILWAHLGAIAELHRVHRAGELWVTSLRRPPGPRPSKHSPAPGLPCTAADLRRWELDRVKQLDEFVAAIRARYGATLAVLVEPDEMTPAQIAERGGLEKIAPHVHIQLRDQPTFSYL